MIKHSNKKPYCDFMVLSRKSTKNNSRCANNLDDNRKCFLSLCYKNMLLPAKDENFKAEGI